MAESGSLLFANKLYSNVTYEALGRDILNWYVQHQTVIWTVAALIPIVVTFILPVIMLTLVYISALYLKAYRYYYKINGYTFTPKCWEPARSILAYFWDAQARFWYGYDIEGLENIPSKGPALIVFYHGAMPVDWYYLLAKTILHKNRLICAVGDRFLFKVPANHSSFYRKHQGSIFYTKPREKLAARDIYESTRIPLVPIYGGFPVKLKTYIGQPVAYDPEITPDEMAERVANKMKDMIKKHQKLPGSISRSVLERIQHLFKLKSV